MALAGFTHANIFHDNTNYLGGGDYISPELLELLENNKVENNHGNGGMDCLPNYPQHTQLLTSFFGTCDTFEQKHSIFNHDHGWDFSSSPSLGASMLISFDYQNYLEDYQNDGVIEPNYLEFSTDYNLLEEQLGWGYLALDDFRDDDEGVRGVHKRPRMDVDGINQSSKKQCVGSQRTPKPMVSKDPQSVAAKNRREKISERLKVLQDLVPNGTKIDLVTMLEKAINYVIFLQLQVKVLATDEFWPENGGKAPEAGEVKEAIEAILASHRDSSTQINT